MFFFQLRTRDYWNLEVPYRPQGLARMPVGCLSCVSVRISVARTFNVNKHTCPHAKIGLQNKARSATHKLALI
ncbi:MAG: hypothetical protein ACPIOQ_22655 [Promethearchaeia archaeon]